MRLPGTQALPSLAGVAVFAAHLDLSWAYDLYVMNADGSHPPSADSRRRHEIPIDHGGAGRFQVGRRSRPVWAADGRSIFFLVNHAEDRAEAGYPDRRYWKAYAVNSTGRPSLRRASSLDLVGQPRYPSYDYGKQGECSTNSPRAGMLAFYRPILVDVGAGSGFGEVGIPDAKRSAA